MMLHCPEKYADKYTAQAMMIMKRGTRRIFHALTLPDLQQMVKDAGKGKAKTLSPLVVDACAAVAATGEPPSVEGLARVVKALMLADREKILEQRTAQRAARAEAEPVGGGG